MKKLFKYPIIIIFLIFTIVLTVVDIVSPNKTFSNIENRYLATKPKLTIENVFNNKFSTKYETYINDHFVLRDSWINIKSLSETCLGKLQNNMITYGSDDYMFEVIEKYNKQKLYRNSDFIRKFVEKYPKSNITLTIVPTSYMILEDKLPYGIVKEDSLEYIRNYYNSLSHNTNLTCINYTDTLKEHSNEYIYYKTDHHWTSLGAYYAYLEYSKQKGLNTIDINDLKQNIVENFYGTFYNKSKLFTAKPDKISYYDIPVDHFEYEEDNVKSSLYDFNKFKTRDKYSAFLYGNNGLTYIKSANNLNKTNGKTSRLLIIKDSYANCFIPFLTFNYDEIHVVDLRGLPVPISELQEQYDYDDVLIMYNFVSFMNDNNLSRLLK